MAVAPIQPKGVQPIKVNIPTPVIKDLQAGIYRPNAQIVATNKDGGKFITTLTNVIDWLITTGSKVAEVLNNLGIINTKQLTSKIPQIEAEESTTGTGEEIEITTGTKETPVQPKEKPVTPNVTNDKIKVFGLELTTGEAILGTIGLVFLGKKAKIF
jgi:hypothetical protein